MRFSDFIWKNVQRRKFRSILTGIGVAIAIAAVVALLGVSQGFERSLSEVYDTRGVDLMVHRAGTAQWQAGRLDDSLTKTLASLPHVQSATAALGDTRKFSEEGVVGNAIHGWPADSFLFNDLHLVEGAKIAADTKNEIMLGSPLARGLKKKVGDTVKIEGVDEEFKVVGIFTTNNVFESAAAVMSLGDLQRISDKAGVVNEFQIVLEPNLPNRDAVIDDLRDKIANLTNAEGQKLGLAALTTADFVRENSEIQLARAMAWMTSSIALVIGSVGVLNTMIMSVLERTQEIGILRAIGWRRKRIVRMILSESFTISFIGAILGIALAVGITQGLSHLPELNGKVIRGDISLNAVGIGLLMAVLVGLVGGAYPALRGANLPPTEALRYE